MTADVSRDGAGGGGAGGGRGAASPETTSQGWECVVGLEIHVQLDTATKMFCGCPVTFGEAPNTQVCPICLGHPGTLPVTNERAVEYALRIALALDCTIADHTIFHRKNYFYPDLPKGYQISQYDLPLGVMGHLDAELEDGSTFRVGITRVHMEEDAGKLIHSGGADGRIQGADYSLADFNRGGTPLVEIVTEPDIRSPEQARAFLVELKSLIEHLEVSDVNMEEGSLRCDANVSVRRPGDPFGVKTELKNMNSFRYLQRGLEAEIERQIAALEDDDAIQQATVHFDPTTGRVTTLRSKEEAHDYRYFPEPDLVPIEIDAEHIDKVRAALPELPAARRVRLAETYGLSAYDAGVLSANRALGDYFERVAQSTGDGKLSANWVMGDLAAHLNAAQLAVEESAVGPERLGGLLALLIDGTLSGKLAKEVFQLMLETGRDAAIIVEERGLGQISDIEMLDTLIAAIVEANPGPAEEFRQGHERVIGFFVGQVMKQTKGQANPQLVNDLLRRHLAG